MAATQKASDENDRTLKLGVILQNFLDNNLLGESFTFDAFIEIAQKNHSKPDQIFDRIINMKSSVTKTQSSSEDDDKENVFSDLHYEIVLKENVKDKISGKMAELNEMLLELQKKKEAEAEALAAQEQNNEQDAEQPAETVVKVVDPLENIKTEKEKREWVLRELKMFETTESQRKKFDMLKN